jgi:hypothetical protein
MLESRKGFNRAFRAVFDRVRVAIWMSLSWGKESQPWPMIMKDPDVGEKKKPRLGKQIVLKSGP